MQIIEMSLQDLKPYENNPRINDKAVEVVAKSIEEFGFKNPIIVDKDNVIVAGHTRYRASKRLGLETVPVIMADDLTPEQVKAFRIMDNKSAEMAEWDYEKLKEELESLQIEEYDLNLTGLSPIEIDDLLDDEPLDVEEVELPKESSDVATTQNDKLTFGKYKVVLTAEEFEMLEKEYLKYVEINRNNYGFIFNLLGGR